MTISSETLQAFIAGELPAEEKGSVAMEIAKDPELMAYVEDQKAVKAAMASPVAVWVRRMVEAARTGRSFVAVSAMAGGIILGVALAASYGMGTEMLSQGGMLIAQGELAHVLSTALISEPEEWEPGAARIGESFWSKNGSFCRSFMTDRTAREALSGIACREANAWRIAILAAATPESPGAEPEMPATIRSVLDNMIVGESLDADAEHEARRQGWRPR